MHHYLRLLLCRQRLMDSQTNRRSSRKWPSTLQPTKWLRTWRSGTRRYVGRSEAWVSGHHDLPVVSMNLFTRGHTMSCLVSPALSKTLQRSILNKSNILIKQCSYCHFNIWLTWTDDFLQLLRLFVRIARLLIVFHQQLYFLSQTL